MNSPDQPPASYSHPAVALRLTNVAKSFDGRAVLRDVTVAVGYGEILAILGASGAGKTTLLRLIAGLEDQDSGTIHLSATPKGNEAAVSYVFQEAVVFPRLSVEENLLLRSSPTELQRLLLPQVYQVLGLEGLEQDNVMHLSGGERKRISLGRALVDPKPIFLLDEPLAEVDYHLAQRIRSYIRAMVDERKLCCVYVTHNPAEALLVADRLAVLAGGELLSEDNPTEMYFRPSSLAVAEMLGPYDSVPVRVLGVDPATGRYRVSLGGGSEVWVRSARRIDGPRGILMVRPQSGVIVTSTAQHQIKNAVFIQGDLRSSVLTPFGVLGKIAANANGPLLTLHLASELWDDSHRTHQTVCAALFQNRLALFEADHPA